MTTLIINPVIKFVCRLLRRLGLPLLVLTLAACSSAPVQPEIDEAAAPEEEVSNEPTASESVEPEDHQDPQSTDDLSSELLFDLLLANIARQRDEAEVALEAMVRAAYRSRDDRVTGSAIRMALQSGDFQQAIELSRFLVSLNPDEIMPVLALVNAQFRAGQIDEPLEQLRQLATEQPLTDGIILQEISNLLARQVEKQDEDSNAADEWLTNFVTPIPEYENQAQLWFTAGLFASRIEKTEQFVDYMRLALEAAPGWETASIIKLTHLSRGDDDEFRTFAKQYMADHPEQSRFRTQYARVLLQKDEIEEALSELETALSHQADLPDALYTAGLVNLDQGDFDKARPLLEAYLEQDEGNDQIRLYLAEAYYELEELELASEQLRRINSAQYYFEAQISLAKVIAKQTDVDSGVRFLKRIDTREQQQKIRLILEQDLLYRDYEKFDQAKGILDDALQSRPSNPDLLYNRGLLAAEMDLLEVHEQDMRTLIEIQPENAHAYNALGYTLADQTERFDEAFELITKALELAPDDPFILDSMGWVHYRKGNFEEAINYLRQALASKEDAEIAAHLGEVLWLSGSKEEAREIWKLGKEWGPENATLIETLERLTPDDSSI